MLSLSHPALVLAAAQSLLLNLKQTCGYKRAFLRGPFVLSKYSMREHGITTASYNVTGDLEFITIYTLFDITRTGVLKNYTENFPVFVDDADQLVRNQPEWSRSRNQQRNFETLMQIVSLRAQPIMLENPKKITASAQSLNFGANYSGSHSVWTVSFATEHADVYTQNSNPLGLLITECHNVPMIVGLTETFLPDNQFMQTSGINTNTVFMINKRLEAQYVAR